MEGRRLRFGTAGAGRNIFSEAWTNERHAFAAEGARTTNVHGTRQHVSRDTRNLGDPFLVSDAVLEDFPIDVLLVDEGDDNLTDNRYWEEWIKECSEEIRPDLVVICANPNELVADGGYHEKPWRERVERLGYEPGFWFMRATDHGGVVWQDRLVMILQKATSTRPKLGPGPTPGSQGTANRAASNMLKPHSIPTNAWYRGRWK